MAIKFKKKRIEKRTKKETEVLKLDLKTIKLKIKSIIENINYGKS